MKNLKYNTKILNQRDFDFECNFTHQFRCGNIFKRSKLAKFY